MTANTKILITRLENAVYEEAMAEARDASDVTTTAKEINKQFPIRREAK